MSRDVQLEDTLWAGLTDSYINTPMGMTAENLAEEYEISREAVDDFALQSQTRWKKGTSALSKKYTDCDLWTLPLCEETFGRLFMLL